MAIEITNSTPEEQLHFKNIFMLKLTVSQALIENISGDPQYCVSIIYRKYAIDSAGGMHYTPEIDTINIPNYLPEALIKAADGDMDLLNALGAIEIAITNIIAEKRNIPLSVV